MKSHKIRTIKLATNDVIKYSVWIAGGDCKLFQSYTIALAYAIASEKELFASNWFTHIDIYCEIYTDNGNNNLEYKKTIKKMTKISVNNITSNNKL